MHLVSCSVKVAGIYIVATVVRRAGMSEVKRKFSRPVSNLRNCPNVYRTECQLPFYSSVQWVTGSLPSKQVSGVPFLKVKVTRFLSGTPGERSGVP
jgi:hypothetical protein